MGGTGGEFFTVDDVERRAGNHINVPREEVGSPHAVYYKLCTILPDHHDTGSVRVFIPDWSQSVHACQTIISGSPDFSTGRLFVHSADAGWSESQRPSAELLDGYSS